MRKCSPREKARWAHYRMRGSLVHARKTLTTVRAWAHQNKYYALVIGMDQIMESIYKAQDLIPTHPSEEYLKRNS